MSEQKQMRESPSASLLMDLRTSSDSQGVPSPLLALSTAPTKQQIDEFKDVPISDLPSTSVVSRHHHLFFFPFLAFSSHASPPRNVLSAASGSRLRQPRSTHGQDQFHWL